jgi:hypothetical protein
MMILNTILIKTKYNKKGVIIKINVFLDVSFNGNL